MLVVPEQLAPQYLIQSYRFSGENNMTGFWTRSARFVPVHQNHPMKTLYILYILF
jgi:hypothetical protein